MSSKDISMLRTTFKVEKEGDVKEFLYTYVNFLMSGKSEDEKAESLFPFLSGDARMKYKNKCISGWPLNEVGHKFPKICHWLVQDDAKKGEPEELIRVSIEASFDFKTLLVSLAQLCDKKKMIIPRIHFFQTSEHREY